MTYRLLTLCKVIDKRLWGWGHPLRQFPTLPETVLSKLEERRLTVDKLKDMRKDEIGASLQEAVATCAVIFGPAGGVVLKDVGSEAEGSWASGWPSCSFDPEPYYSLYYSFKNAAV